MEERLLIDMSRTGDFVKFELRDEDEIEASCVLDPKELLEALKVLKLVDCCLNSRPYP